MPEEIRAIYYAMLLITVNQDFEASGLWYYTKYKADGTMPPEAQIIKRLLWRLKKEKLED